MNAVSIGRTIRSLRKQNNMSMQELGDKVALSQASISRLESGVTDINFAQLSNVCEVFELTLTEFFAMVEKQMDLKLDVSPVEVKTIDDKLIDIIQQLSDDQKKGLYVLLQPYVKWKNRYLESKWRFLRFKDNTWKCFCFKILNLLLKKQKLNTRNILKAELFKKIIIYSKDCLILEWQNGRAALEIELIPLHAVYRVKTLFTISKTKCLPLGETLNSYQ